MKGIRSIEIGVVKNIVYAMSDWQETCKFKLTAPYNIMKDIKESIIEDTLESGFVIGGEISEAPISKLVFGNISIDLEEGDHFSINRVK